MFKDAKVGDRVYCLKNGWGSIISSGAGRIHPLYVEFDGGDCDNYTLNGEQNIEDRRPTLYWGEPQIIAPPKPKRLVKKTVTRYLNIFNNEAFGGILHSTAEEAEKHGIGSIAIATVTYDIVEEE